MTLQPLEVAVKVGSKASFLSPDFFTLYFLNLVKRFTGRLVTESVAFEVQQRERIKKQDSSV